MPNNANRDASYGYAGKFGKLTESAIANTPIYMGKRVYLPTQGRFIQVDPIEGGVENNYVYPADPMNESDLSGMCPICGGGAAAALGLLALRAAAGVAAKQIAKQAAKQAAKEAAKKALRYTVDKKIAKQMVTRGWNHQRIREAIKSPARKVSVRDTRHLSNGKRLDDPATAYYSRDGGYVVRNNRTKQIVQVSNRYDKNWKAPWE